MQIAKADADRILKLSGELRIHVAEELRAALLDYVCAASRPAVDLSEVTACDTAGLQLLIAAGRTAEDSAKPLELVAIPAAVRAAAAALGLSANLAPDAGPASRGCEDAK